MQGIKRRIVQAFLYEIILLVISAPIIALVFNQDLTSSVALIITVAIMALFWSMLFNMLFERWERANGIKKRELKHRVYHAVGFEVGFMIISVPVIAWFLKMSLLHTLFADIGIALGVMMYTFFFQLVFDKVFGEPQQIIDNVQA